MVCSRCGLCCHFYLDGTLTKCRFLSEFNGEYSCRIYYRRDRFSRVLAKDSFGNVIKCINRSDYPFNFEGCPYNSPSNLDSPITKNLIRGGVSH
jgi:hypothetical protein